MAIRTLFAAASIIATTTFACAQDDLPSLGVYEASCGPTFACTLLLSSGVGDDDTTVTLIGTTTTDPSRIVCRAEAQARPGVGRTTVGDQEIDGLDATLQGVPVVVTGLSDGNSVLMSAQDPICPVEGMPNGGRHLAVVGIYDRQAED